MTLPQHLAKLKDFILLHNPYFKHGFDAVVLEESGYVAENGQIVFPADDLGNYFYLRLPNNLQADYNPQYSIADSYQSIGVKYDIILVACVVNGDNGKMLENIITTLGRYNDEPLRMTKLLHLADDIVIQELSKIGKENAEAALQRFPENMGICSVHFTFTIPYIFQQLKCLQDPCKTCS